MINFLFRKPKFPIITNFDGYLIAAKSLAEIERKINKININPKKLYQVIDATIEGWSFSSDHLCLSPLSIKKRWTKKEIIALYNNSENCKKNQIAYSEKSLANKKVETIFEDIVNLINMP